MIVKNDESNVKVNGKPSYSPHSFLEGTDSVDMPPHQSKGYSFLEGTDSVGMSPHQSKGSPKSSKSSDRNKEESSVKKRPLFMYPSKPGVPKSVDASNVPSSRKQKTTEFNESIQSTLVQKPIPGQITVTDSVDDEEPNVIKIERIGPGDFEYNTTPPELRQKDDTARIKSLLGVHPGSGSKKPHTERRRNAEDDDWNIQTERSLRQQRDGKARSEMYLDDYRPKETAGFSRGWFSEVKTTPTTQGETNSNGSSSWRGNSNLESSPRDFDFNHQSYALNSYEVKASRRDNHNHNHHHDSKSNGREEVSWRASSHEGFFSPQDFDSRFDPSDSYRSRSKDSSKGKSLRRVNSHQPTMESHNNKEQNSATSKVLGFFRAAKKTLRKHKSVNSNQHYSTNRQEYFEKNIGNI